MLDGMTMTEGVTETGRGNTGSLDGQEYEYIRKTDVPPNISVNN